MNRDTSDEYATAATLPPLRFHPDDRVEVRASGQTGTVTYSASTPKGEFVTVELDGRRRKKEEILAGKLRKIESLF